MKIVYSIFFLVAICSAKSLLEIEEDEDRIVGGVATDISVFPYIVSIRNRRISQSARDFTHTCGGSIYDEWTIITAAHCVIGKIASQLKVVAGSNYRTGTSGIIIPVAELVFHDEYNPELYDYDVAFLILEDPLPLNNFTMQTIEFTDKNDFASGTTATLSGWGTLSSRGSSPYQLRTVQVPYVDRETCQRDYDVSGSNITERMICAGVRGVGGRDTCQGDSGGPFVIENKLVGIVSWGNGCALPAYPGVYSNVNYFVPWFTQQIAEAKLRHNIV